MQYPTSLAYRCNSLQITDELGGISFSLYYHVMMIGW